MITLPIIPKKIGARYHGLSGCVNDT